MSNSVLPREVGEAKPLYYAILTSEHRKTGKTRHFVDGQLVESISILVIAQYENENGYYLFGCDEGWQTITDTYHDSIEDAKDQAEFEYGNTLEAWNHLQKRIQNPEEWIEAWDAREDDRPMTPLQISFLKT